MRKVAVTSEETSTVAAPVVERNEAGARTLGARYWRAVEAVTRRWVRVDERGESVALRPLRRGPALIRLGPPELQADEAAVACRYPIIGGLLVRRPGGWLSLEQIAGDPVVLRSTLTGFFPRLPAALYAQGQARVHAAVSRRFFARLEAETR